MISLRKVLFINLVSIFFLPLLADACSCGRGTTTLADDVSSSRAVFAGRVLYTNRSIQWKWLNVLNHFYEFTNISPPEYNPRIHGVKVTFQVINSWKGQQEDVVTLVTGYGTGDCGIWFERGNEALVFVNQYHNDWYDVSLCSRTQPLADAVADITMLGPPLKLKHKSVPLHFAKNNLSWIIFFAIFGTVAFGCLKLRKQNKKSDETKV
jgi:hypothetical protein